MQSDLEIARAAKMEDISSIAWKLGIGDEELMRMGIGKAKITWDALKNRISKPQGSLILVTSVNPTPFGEGKTVTTIGLTQALNRIGKRATCVIREPSMGPVFGIKGALQEEDYHRFSQWRISTSTSLETFMQLRAHTTFSRL